MEHGIVEVIKEASVAVQITMAFMLLLSIYTVFRVIERVLTYRSASDQTISFVLGLRGHLKGGRYDDALKSADAHGKSPVAKVIGSALRAYQQGREALSKHGPNDVGDFDIVDAVNRALERVKDRETSGLRKGLAGLGTVATTTPFIGLFGTVIGIINAFALLKGNATIEVIGPAIAEALYATAFGLLVAIVAAMAFNYCTNRVEEMTVDMNDISSEFLDVVLREGRSIMGGAARRAGHGHRGRIHHTKQAGFPPPKSDINVTPLVDVVLVLLIIFMVITPMMSRGKDVQLPKTDTHYNRKDKMQPVVAVDDRGVLWYEKDKIGEVSPDTLATLKDRITRGWAKVKDAENANRVYLKASKDVAYEKVYPVLMAINEMGVQSIDLGTNEREGK